MSDKVADPNREIKEAAQNESKLIIREAQGRVVPDAFTHGTSEQRMYWFKKGFDTGDLNQGDTFNASRLE